MNDHGQKSSSLAIKTTVLSFLFAAMPACKAKNDRAEGAQGKEAIDTIVDIRELVGKSQADVTDVVGSEPACEPDNVPDLGEGQRCKWSTPSIDALFFQDKLHRAEISGASVRFDARNGAAYGFESPPTLQNNNVIKWELEGLEGSMFPDGSGGVSHFYVKKVMTPEDRAEAIERISAELLEVESTLSKVTSEAEMVRVKKEQDRLEVELNRLKSGG